MLLSSRTLCTCGCALLLHLTSGCSQVDNKDATLTRKHQDTTMIVESMVDVASGYKSSERDWMAFLRCWSDGVSKRLGKKAIVSDRFLGSKSAEEIQALIRESEARLGKKLPKSYEDFVRVTGGGWMVESAGPNQKHDLPSNLLPVAQIGNFWEVDRRNWASWERALNGVSREPLTANDYYRYGYKESPSDLQDRFRWEHLEYLIKIGELEQGTVLLLNPREITSDGEWEAWLLSPQVGAKRYRSFAELMQTIAYQDVLDKGGFFLPSSTLRATCAVHLVTAATS